MTSTKEHIQAETHRECKHKSVTPGIQKSRVVRKISLLGRAFSFVVEKAHSASLPGVSRRSVMESSKERGVKWVFHLGDGKRFDTVPRTLICFVLFISRSECLFIFFTPLFFPQNSELFRLKIEELHKMNDRKDQEITFITNIPELLDPLGPYLLL